MGRAERETREELGLIVIVSRQPAYSIEVDEYSLHLFRADLVDGGVNLSEEHSEWAYFGDQRLKKLALTIESEFMLGWAGYFR